MNNRPPNHRLPPPYAILALITFCAIGLTILISALNEIYHATP